jgi:hypothetical protein
MQSAAACSPEIDLETNPGRGAVELNDAARIRKAPNLADRQDRLCKRRFNKPGETMLF